MLSRAIVTLESTAFTVLISSATQPAVTDRDKLWLNLNDSRIYAWYGGSWLYRHPYEANGLVRLIYTGTEEQLETFDGGDTDLPGEASGPMWEKDPDAPDMDYGFLIRRTRRVNYKAT